MAEVGRESSGEDAEHALLPPVPALLFVKATLLLTSPPHALLPLYVRHPGQRQPLLMKRCPSSEQRLFRCC